MDTTSTTFLVMDLAGTFAFALNGAWTAMKVARLDIVGVVVLGMLTALGGGFLRDTILGALPPATFQDWRYLAVAATGSVIAFVAARILDRVALPIVAFDAAGLSLFAVSGAMKGLGFEVGAAQAIILGALTAVGGGTLRDVVVRQIPTVLSSGLYAIPALAGALVVVVGHALGADLGWAAVAGATLCFLIRIVGVRYDVNAPAPPRPPDTT